MTSVHPTDPDRRELLKRGGSLAASALGGCACPMPSWRMGKVRPLQPGPLAPPPPQEGTLDVPLVIDAHCHIFNVEDVPATRMLEGPVAHYLGAPQTELMKAFPRVISAIAHFLAPSARAEYRTLEELSAGYFESPRAALQAVDARMNDQWDAFATLFSAAAAREGFSEPYARQRKFYLDAMGSRTGKALDEDELSAEAIYRRLEAGPPPIERAIPEFNGAPPFEQSIAEFDPGQLIYFAFSLTSPRYLNLTYLQRTYSGGPGSPAVDVFCPSQLDFNHWLGCTESATCQDDQVRLLEQIAIMSHGSILPFVAYNPLTDLIADDASFKRVVTAVCRQGFIGVKIYPPMGFRPFGNSPGLLAETCPSRPDALEVDARLARLYAWCADHNVPVMAHTSHSFGDTDAHNECAAPTGWKLAIQCFKGLRVQGGHFGGESEYALRQEKWAEQYVDIMSQPGGGNLYVDLSNLGNLFVSGSPVHEVIDPLVLRPIAGAPGQIVADRMVYGSDWYMNQLTRISGTYLREACDYFGEIECREKVRGLRNRVLGLNAAKLYGLDPSTEGGTETNWDRLTRYYDAKGIGTPTWMSRITGSRPPDRC